MQLLSFLKACRDHESDLILKKVNTNFFFDFEDPQIRNKTIYSFSNKKTNERL